MVELRIVQSGGVSEVRNQLGNGEEGLCSMTDGRSGREWVIAVTYLVGGFVAE
jgi:putative hemolysin